MNDMRYIGNFKEWINPLWLEFVLSNRGDGRPAEGQKPDSKEMELEYQRARDAGYKEDAIYFWMFDRNNTNFDIENIPFSNKKFYWWITKMLPGQFMPMHVDPHAITMENCERFWIPLQDWQAGHIFMYEDQVITNYRAGDVWTYKDSTALHGAANIGFIPRVVLQISSYGQ